MTTNEVVADDVQVLAKFQKIKYLDQQSNVILERVRQAHRDLTAIQNKIQKAATGDAKLAKLKQNLAKAEAKLSATDLALAEARNNAERSTYDLLYGNGNGDKGKSGSDIVFLENQRSTIKRQIRSIKKKIENRRTEILGLLDEAREAGEHHDDVYGDWVDARYDVSRAIFDVVTRHDWVTEGKKLFNDRLDTAHASYDEAGAKHQIITSGIEDAEATLTSTHTHFITERAEYENARIMSTVSYLISGDSTATSEIDVELQLVRDEYIADKKIYDDNVKLFFDKQASLAAADHALRVAQDNLSNRKRLVAKLDTLIEDTIPDNYGFNTWDPLDGYELT